MVEHEAVVAVLHFQKRRTDEPVISPELDESTLGETQVGCWDKRG